MSANLSGTTGAALADGSRSDTGQADTGPKRGGGAAQGQGRRIVLLDAADAPSRSLRGQILTAVKQGFSARAQWVEYGAEGPDTLDGTLSLSLFPRQRADALMMYDLADRRHFDQTGPDGTPLIAQFRKILVPGNWLKRYLLANHGGTVKAQDVLVTGAPRIDYLRRLQAARPAPAEAAPGAPDTLLPRVLFAPLHDNWNGRDGRPMSVAAPMAPLLEDLAAHCALTVEEDPRNTRGKQPVTEALLEADIVITDYTALIYEAWALGKPVIFPRWLAGDRVLEKAHRSAEAHIYRERIGHHADSFEDLCALVGRGRDLDLGPGVDDFMAQYIDNYRGGDAGRAVARVLERLADPSLQLTENRLRAAAEGAAHEGDWPRAADLFHDLAAMVGADDPTIHDRLAQVLNRAGRRGDEARALRAALRHDPLNAKLMDRLAAAESALGRWRAAAAAHAEIIALNPAKATSDRHYRLGHALETEGTDGPADPRAARAAYDRACALDTRRNAAQFGVGVLHTGAGRWKEAQEAFRAQIARHPGEPELYYRLGMAHDRCYEWAEAEACYRDALTLDTTKSIWHYRLGFVLERQARHAEAAQAYDHAARLSGKHQPGWFYRAGHAFAQAGALAEACAAYAGVRVGKSGKPVALPAPNDGYRAGFAAARAGVIERILAQDSGNVGLWLKLSHAHEETGALEAAARAMDKVIEHARDVDGAHFVRQATLEARLRQVTAMRRQLERDCTNPVQWQVYSTSLEKSGDLEGAIAAMQQAVMRSDTHRPAWHHRLGVLLWRAERPAEACAAFADMQILRRPHGIWEDRFETDAALKETATYREFHDCLPIRPRTILYESFGGEGISDSPLALFDHLQTDPRFDGWTHVWVIDDIATVPAPLRARQDVFFVRKDSTLYKRWLATAEYLINNATFPYYFVRRDGQKYLNTWHGTPLKTLGYDIAATPLQRANTARNLIQASMFIAPNTHTEEVMLGRYGVRNLFTGRALISGYPRIDKLVNATDTLKADLRAQLGLDPDKPMVLFAPTYRGHWATPELETEEIIATIEAMKSDAYNLVFRGHYFAEKTLLEMDLPVTIAPHAIDSCQLLAITDVLVSDYSSIFYDFLITGRPVIHYIPDWDDYVRTRGTYFGREALPGLDTETHDQLRAALAACIADPGAQISDRYRRARDLYCHMEDGRACDRVIEALFFADPPPAQPPLPEGARHLLFYCGAFDDTPVTDAARALLAATQQAGHVNTVLADRRLLIDNAPRTAAAQALLDRADVLIRFGRACMTPEEAWINSTMAVQGYTPTPAMEAVFSHAIAHEVRRLLGHARFDAAIEFEGARPFWSNVISAVPAGRHLFRAEEDLAEAAATRTPAQERVIARLHRFDTLLSPSQGVAARNRQGLQGVTGLPDAAFRAAPPVLAPEVLRTRAVAEPVGDPDYTRLRAHPGPRILCPLPPEGPADQALLADALAQLGAARDDAALWVAVQGPERAPLAEAAARAGVQGRVHALGMAGRDMLPFLHLADCLVFGAGHDPAGLAQMLPVALLLGRGCVLAAPEDSLADGIPPDGALRVAPRPGDLAAGIDQVLSGVFHPAPFDARAHDARALGGFLAAALGETA